MAAEDRAVPAGRASRSRREVDGAERTRGAGERLAIPPRNTPWRGVDPAGGDGVDRAWLPANDRAADCEAAARSDRHRRPGLCADATGSVGRRAACRTDLQHLAVDGWTVRAGGFVRPLALVDQ